MTIPIPAGMEPTPQDVERGTIEEIAVFSINAEEGTLTLLEVAGFEVTKAAEEEAMGETIPSEEETLEQFVEGVRKTTGV